MNTLTPDKTRYKVWVIDDDETVLLMAEEILGGEGFEVYTFPQASNALEAMASRLPDVLLLDVMLPDMDGFEFCARLRDHPGGEHLPVLMTTALDDSASINRAYEAGATGFVTKPLNWDIELHRLRYMLRSAETAQKLRREEQETRLAKDDWERTFNAIPDCVTVLDEKFCLLRANSATTKALNKPIDHILGRPCYELFCGASEYCPNCPVIQAKASSLPATAEMAYCSPNSIWQIIASPLVATDGQSTRFVHVARDVSNQRELEVELRQILKMEAVGTLAGGVAHEFNNLLQVITGFAEILLEKASKTNEDITILEAIIQAASRSSALTKQLLTFSRKSALQSEKRPLNLNCEVQNFHKMLRQVLPKSISIDLQLAQDLRICSADSSQMHQVLLNFAVNASHAMPDGGKLTIATRNTQLEPKSDDADSMNPPVDFVMLSVSDTGHGMSKETLQHIYEPFFTTKGLGKGTGLGLSVVFGIVKDHGGTIHCESQPGKGATFQIQLPALDSAMVRLKSENNNKAVATAGVGTILFVDDEPDLRSMVGLYLSRLGYTVKVAESGERALTSFGDDKTPPQLVILDLGMPGMGGWECLKKLRLIDPVVKVLIATGYGGDDIEAQIKQWKADGLLMKPYGMATLATKVGEMLDEEVVLKT